MKISVLGLGLMGGEIAVRLQRQGREVIGWNRGAAHREAAAQQRLNLAATPAEAVVASDLIVLVLSDANAIEQTLFAQLDPSAMAGRTFIQMGTIAPGESREIAKRVEGRGGDYLEAPVLGSLPEAREGALILMAGGDRGLYERSLPVLKDLSANPQWIGAVGQAAALKLAMNQLIAGLTSSFALSLALVRREGIDVDQFMGLLRGSALYAKTFDKKLDRYLSHAYGDANFPLKHLRKDVRLFQQVAEERGLDITLIAAMERICARAEAAGLGDKDYSALYEALSREPSPQG